MLTAGPVEPFHDDSIDLRGRCQADVDPRIVG